MMGMEARFLQQTWRQRTGPDVFGDEINRTWMWRGKEKQESRLSPWCFSRTTGQMVKALGGWDFVGRQRPRVTICT